MWFFQNHKWKMRHDPRIKDQASSVKPQAPIFRKNSFGNRTRSLAESCLTSDGGTRSMAARDLVQTSSLKHQASEAPSDKLQAQSNKRQASSLK